MSDQEYLEKCTEILKMWREGLMTEREACNTLLGISVVYLNQKG